MRHKVIVDNNAPKIKRMCDMKRGECGIIVNSDYIGIIVMKTHGYTVSLKDGDYWGSTCTLNVELFTKGTEVKLIIGE